MNAEAIGEDLLSSWEVLAEPVQTIMRKYGLPEPYEQLKAATRGRALDEHSFNDILERLDLPAQAVLELKSLTPSSYTGLAAQLARMPLPDK